MLQMRNFLKHPGDKGITAIFGFFPMLRTLTKNCEGSSVYAIPAQYSGLEVPPKGLRLPCIGSQNSGGTTSP